MSYFQLVVNSYTVGKTSSWRWWKKKLINLSISFFCDQSETIYWLMESVKKQCQLPMLPGDCVLRKCQHRFLGQWSIETSLKDKGFPNLFIVEAVSDPIKTCANNKYCTTRAGLCFLSYLKRETTRIVQNRPTADTLWFLLIQITKCPRPYPFYTTHSPLLGGTKSFNYL